MPSTPLRPLCACVVNLLALAATAAGQHDPRLVLVVRDAGDQLAFHFASLQDCFHLRLGDDHRAGYLVGGHRVVAFDLPGFGASEMPDWQISISGYGRWLDALYDALTDPEAARA